MKTLAEALPIVRSKIIALDAGADIDDIMLHGVLEDILIENAAPFLSENAVNFIESMDSRSAIEALLQKELTNYPQILDTSVTQLVDEYQHDDLGE